MLTSFKKVRFPSLRRIGLAVEHYPGYINRKIRMHAVDVVLLSFIIRGHGKHMIGSETFVETGGSLAVTHYGQQHDILTDSRGMDVFNLYLDLQNHPMPTLPLEFQAVLPLFLPLHPKFQHKHNRIVRLQFDDPQPLTDLLFAIRRELDTCEPGYLEVVPLLFKLFLIHCCRHAMKTGFVANDPSRSPQRALEELRSHLDHHYAEPHTLESLSKKTRLSRTYLCRAFKAYTGKSVFDYLIERRIQAAMMQLRGSDLKILGIALECGFSDLSYFNRKFKQLVGITPTQYRMEVVRR